MKFTVFFLLSTIFFNKSNAQKSFTIMVDELLAHTVPEIDSDSLLKITDKVTLLDAREKKEFNVSHLEDARYAGYNSFNKSCLKGLNKNSPIVVYCSVGYRSEKIVEKLEKMGYNNVSNLSGGIFDWANQSHPIYQKGIRTQKVHAYNKEWGKWLIKADKIYE